jgi:hypothetical protein
VSGFLGGIAGYLGITVADHATSTWNYQIEAGCLTDIAVGHVRSVVPPLLSHIDQAQPMSGIGFDWSVRASQCKVQRSSDNGGEDYDDHPYDLIVAFTGFLDCSIGKYHHPESCT